MQDNKDANDKEHSFTNALKAVDRSRSLPQRIFVAGWLDFLFCESDQVFSASFVRTIKVILDAEAATTCCMLKLSPSIDIKIDTADCFFFDRQTEPANYQIKLNARSPYSWVINPDQYVASSDKGNWALFCDKAEEVAIVAFRSSYWTTRLGPALSEIHAVTADVYVDRPGNGPFPNIPLTSAWSSEILRNFRRPPK
jgi:hypothetical protein